VVDESNFTTTISGGVPTAPYLITYGATGSITGTLDASGNATVDCPTTGDVAVPGNAVVTVKTYPNTVNEFSKATFTLVTTRIPVISTSAEVDHGNSFALSITGGSPKAKYLVTYGDTGSIVGTLDSNGSFTVVCSTRNLTGLGTTAIVVKLHPGTANEVTANTSIVVNNKINGITAGSAVTVGQVMQVYVNGVPNAPFVVTYGNGGSVSGTLSIYGTGSVDCPTSQTLIAAAGAVQYTVTTYPNTPHAKSMVDSFTVTARTFVAGVTETVTMGNSFTAMVTSAPANAPYTVTYGTSGSVSGVTNASGTGSVQCPTAGRITAGSHQVTITLYPGTGWATPISKPITVNVVVQGQVEFTEPGTYIWTPPAGVTSFSAVAVGRGADAVEAYSHRAGGGGLGWKNNIPITGPVSIVIGGRTDGTHTSVRVGTDEVVVGRAGQGPNGGSFIGDGGGQGGSAIVTYSGAGAGGYTAAGGNGDSSSASAGDAPFGGGGGGGGHFAAGGGVGLKGQGPSGRGGTNFVNGTPGSNGIPNTANNGVNAAIVRDGGHYGGGGSYGGLGGKGAVRIIWGGGRSYPTNAGDV
jgi:hypothetical protein